VSHLIKYYQWLHNGRFRNSNVLNQGGWSSSCSTHRREHKCVTKFLRQNWKEETTWDT